MELKEGMYVRYIPTQGEYTQKIVKITKMENRLLDWAYYFNDNKEPVFSDEFDDILKASPNLIDLIEVGDYVNGYKVLKVSENKIYMECFDGAIVTDMDFEEHQLIGYTIEPTYINEFQIESIVTKEQFSQMEYKVGQIMTEEQLNKKYLKEILPNCDNKEIEIINKLMSEQYIKGLRQGKFDVQMDLCNYLEEKIHTLPKLTTYFYERDGKHIAETDIQVAVYQDILERINSGKYE